MTINEPLMFIICPQCQRTLAITKEHIREHSDICMAHVSVPCVECDVFVNFELTID
jgi:RNase P subunit RPR2